MTFEHFKTVTHLTNSQISKLFGIPYSTVANWGQTGPGRRQPPEYVINMMWRLALHSFMTGAIDIAQELCYDEDAEK